MPNRDRTGPEGKGPRTGRGLGRCGSNSDPDSQPRKGIGRGTGQGKGYGRRASE